MNVHTAIQAGKRFPCSCHNPQIEVLVMGTKVGTLFWAPHHAWASPGPAPPATVTTAAHDLTCTIWDFYLSGFGTEA
jgi:hypothetical protein